MDKDGFFATGDVGLVDPCGALHIVDRKKEVDFSFSGDEGPKLSCEPVSWKRH